MKPSRHLAISTTTGCAVWAATGEPLTLPLVICSGTLPDIDHAPDLLWTLALERSPVATFVLHAWEWLIILSLISIKLAFPSWSIAIICGYASHIVTDHLANKGKTWSYSIGYRIYHRFDMAKLAPTWDHESNYYTLQKEIPFAAKMIDWLKRKKSGIPSQKNIRPK